MFHGAGDAINVTIIRTFRRVFFFVLFVFRNETVNFIFKLIEPFKVQNFVF